MRIYVCVKRVPSTTLKVRLQPAGDSPPRSIASQGVEFTLSPYDEIALAEAVRLKQTGGGEVIAVSLGSDEAQAVLRTALAMGADGALHLRADAPSGIELDGWQTASALAEALRARSFDLLLFGRLAVDTQSAQVGTLTAELLGIPSAADVVKIEPTGSGFRFHRSVEGRVEVLESPRPAAATAQKGLAEPRYPSIQQILAAKKKAIESVAAVVPEPATEVVGLELPAPRKPGRILGEGAAAVPELLGLLRTEAKVI